MSEDTDQPYQVMPEFDPDEFQRLKKGIKEHGIEYPIIVDTDGNIVDGHHRVKAWKELGRDPSDIPRRVVDEPDGEQYHRAYRVNLNRRDVDKEEIVKDYLLEHQTRVKEDTLREIALDIGVGKSTVNRAKQDLEDDGKLSHLGQFSTEEKKQMVREYIKSNPDVSNRDVASAVECDIAHATVGNWRNKWDIDTTEQTSGLDTFTNSKDETDAALDVAEKATDDNVDEEIRQTASEKVNEITEGKTNPDEAARDVQRKETRKENEQQTPPELPDDEYAVIYADPPWQYDHQEAPNREIENHYGTMSLSDICGLDIPAANDAVLYMWTTAPKLREAFDVIDSWGFEYVTGAVWDKQKIGMGYWFRGQHEHLLVAKRGGISPPDTGARQSSVISEERGKHSAKPNHVYDLIEAAFPDRDRLELFARESREGWESWGDEIE